jgi:hypothetical protein
MWATGTTRRTARALKSERRLEEAEGGARQRGG